MSPDDCGQAGFRGLEVPPGTCLDERYLIEEFAASGGVGEVFRARDLTLDRQVAVKVLKCADEHYVERLRREASMLAAMNHPGIVKVYAFGVVDGYPYLVMDWVDGHSLAQVLARDGILSLDRFFLVFEQVLDALSFAHEHRIVHRDLKPSNIMLCGTSSSESVRLIDFGIAKLAEQTSTQQSLTMSGAVVGSSAYMSPEQCRGQEVDCRSDIYSLGCVMFEALTGQPPYSGDSAMELMYKHLHQSVSGNRALRQLPDAVSRMVRRALEKSPEKRYQTVLEFKVDFQQSKSRGSTRLAGGGTLARQAIFTTLGIVVAWIVGYRFSLHPTGELSGADQLLAPQPSPKVFHERTALILHKNPSEARLVLERWLKDRRNVGTQEVRGNIMLLHAHVLADSGDLAGALRAYRESARLMSKSSGRYIEARLGEAQLLRSLGKIGDGIVLLEKLDTELKGSVMGIGRAQILETMALYQLDLGNLLKAETLFRKTCALLEHPVPVEGSEKKCCQARIEARLGHVLWLRGLKDEANRLFARAEEAAAGTGPGAYDVCKALCDIFLSVEDERAERYVRRLSELAGGIRSRDFLNSYWSRLANIYLHRGNLKRAREMLGRAKELDAKLGRPGTIQAANRLLAQLEEKLAGPGSSRGCYPDENFAVMERKLRDGRGLSTTEMNEWRYSCIDQAFRLAAAKDRQAARRFFDHWEFKLSSHKEPLICLLLAKAHYFRDCSDKVRRTDCLERCSQLTIEQQSPQGLASLWQLAAIYRKRGRFEKARQLLNAALRIGDGVDRPESLLVYLEYAYLEKDLGNLEAAASWLRRLGAPTSPELARMVCRLYGELMLEATQQKMPIDALYRDATAAAGRDADARILNCRYYASALVKAGRQGEARRILEALLADKVATTATRHSRPDLAKCLELMADVSSGCSARIKHLQRAAGLLTGTDESPRKHLALLFRKLAAALSDCQRPGEAAKALRDCIKSCEVSGGGSLLKGAAWKELSRLESTGGHQEEAIRCLEQSRLSLSAGKASANLLAGIDLELADLLSRRARYGDAISLYLRAADELGKLGPTFAAQREAAIRRACGLLERTGKTSEASSLRASIGKAHGAD